MNIVNSDSFGIINISGSTTNVRGPNKNNRKGFYIKNHPDNTYNVFICAHGGTSGSAMVLGMGDAIFHYATNLSMLDFGVFSGSGVVCWQKI